MAIEPYVTQLARVAHLLEPSHSRKLRDPLVASHLLAGLAAGMVFERVVLNGAWAFLSPALS